MNIYQKYKLPSNIVPIMFSESKSTHFFVCLSFKEGREG